MQKTKIHYQEAVNHFVAKYGEGVTVSPIKQIVPSTANEGTGYFEKKLFVNVHGVALNPSQGDLITADGVVQMIADVNGDVFEQRISCVQLDAFYTEGAVVIEGFECVVN